LFRLGYAETTIKHNTSSLALFLSYLKQQNVKELKQAESKHIIAYNEHLHGLKSRITNLGLNGKTIQTKINVVRLFSQYLESTQQLKIFTTTVDIIPTIQKHKEILSQEHIKNLYNQTDDSIIGLRDRAILGLYYGCGLRYKEGIKVELNHIDYKKELLFISPSKNYHSRYVPINNTVLKDFKDYELHARIYFTSPVLFKTQNKNTFLVGNLSNSYLNKWLQNLCNKANINKTITLHSLRHSIATHLLQQEMPLEQIAKFLGHNTIRATQIYTHIVESINHEK
jgi:integrase/recombinase XerD